MSVERAHGAFPRSDGTTLFRVWAPLHDRLEVRVLDPEERVVTSRAGERGYHEAVVECRPGARYLLRLPDGREIPDPASRSQPEGVHGPSAVVDTRAFGWSDAGWHGIGLRDLVVMEIHVGTFTHQGTFDAVIPHLSELRALGITAVEIMPVAQFPGARNWGYDGVLPFAAQDTYGGPEGLMRLVDACHAAGLAVVLDVVYNHLGPEGSHLGALGPYFTERYVTPWGAAVNVDGPDSDEVRRFFIENALMWLEEFHLDALRLDAIHGIFDMSPRPFLAELSEEVDRLGERLGRQLLLIAETDANDARVVTGRARGGLGMHAQWSDDFHHAVHAVLTGERNGYYEDYGDLEQIARALRDGFVYQGEYSRYRRRRHGSPSRDIASERLVVCTQNHDQVGNRMLGERLSKLVGFDALKVAAGLLLCSPNVPMLFMGEEYGEEAPFLYFVSHSDPALIQAVREGRAREFAAFRWNEEPPDPQDEKTFLRSKLDRSLRDQDGHRALHELYRALLALRRAHPALGNGRGDGVECAADDAARTLTLTRRAAGEEVVAIFNLGEHQTHFSLPPVEFRVLLDADEPGWGGSGRASIAPGRATVPAMSFVVLARAGAAR